MKLVSCKSALTNSPSPHPGGLFLGGGPGLSFILCCFVVYSTRRFALRPAVVQLLVFIYSGIQ